MAKAEKKVVTEEVVTTVEKEVVVLELSVEEAQVLRDITGNIGGGVKKDTAEPTDARKANNNICKELSKIFPNWWAEASSPFEMNVNMKDE